MNFSILHRITASLWAALAVICSILPDSSLAQTRPIRVSYSEFNPYSYTDNNGTARGYAIDLIRHIATKAGYDVRFVAGGHPAGMMAALKDGRADLTSLLALTPARLEEAIATDEIGSFDLTAFVATEGPVEDLSDLTGGNIGAVTGSFALKGAEKVPFANVVEFDESDHMLMPLLNGEIDAIVTSRDSYLRRLRSAGLDGAVAPLEPALISSAAALYLPPGNTALQADLNRVIRSGLDKAHIRDLREKWFGRDSSLFDDPIVIWAARLALLLTAVAGFLGYRALVYRGREKQLLRARKGDQLLISALDEVAAAVVIFDKDLRAVHWNQGMELIFPQMVPGLRSGATLRKLLTRSYSDGTVPHDMDDAAIADSVETIIDDMRNGRDTIRIIRLGDGRVFQGRDVPLGKDHYATIRVEITEHQKQQDTIKDQADRLVLANEQLRTFTSIAAHDLKTPLFNQIALLEFIGEDLTAAGIELPSEVRENWVQLENVAQQMLRLVQDLSIYATTDSENQTVELISPSERLKDVLHLAQPRSGFQITIDDDMPDLLVNATAFDMVMRNLLTNAIKHHDKDFGRISVRAQRTDSGLTLLVQDDGPGIAAPFREKIFEPFTRLSTQTDGSGLGLAFIKKTVASWGGTVSVKPAEPRGSVFEVTFPHPKGGAQILPLLDPKTAQAGRQVSKTG